MKFLFLFLPLLTFSQAYNLIPISVTGLPQLGNTRLITADVDGDSDLDVFLMGSDVDGIIRTGFYYNDGNFSFSDAGIPIPRLYRGDAAMADFNMDNAPDLLITGENASGDKKSILYKNNKNGTFSEVSVSLPLLSYSSVAWLDVENDGDMDFFMAGQDTANAFISVIYINNRNEAFQAVTVTGVPPFSNGSVAMADLNRDNFPDLVAGGIDENNNYFSDVYLGTGKGTFVAQNTNLPPLAFNRVSTPDFNADGYADIAISGISRTNVRTTKIYRNNLGAAFLPISSTFSNVDNGGIAWGDVDNDGFADVFFCGRTGGASAASVLYTYAGGNLLNQSAAVFENVSFSDVAIADFNNDAKNDILISGFSSGGPVTYIYRNVGTENISPPTFSGQALALVEADSVRLSWAAFVDDATPADGLTYNVWLSTKKDSFNILSPQASLSNGYNYLNTRGKYTSTTTGWLKKFPEGKYYWRIQATDAAKKSSVFSPIDSFAVCRSISLGNDTSTCFGKTITLIKGSGTDIVNWSVAGVGLAKANSFSYTHTVSGLQNIIISLKKVYGCTLYDTLAIDAIPLPVGTLPGLYKQCFKESYSLLQGLETDTILWYSKNVASLSINRTFTGVALKKDTIFTRITSKFGCVGFDTVVVDTLPLPRIAIKDTAVCKFNSLTISPTYAHGLQWFSSVFPSVAGPSFAIAKLDTNTSLTVKATDTLGCYYFDTLQVRYYPLPTAHAGLDSIICYNVTAQLGALEPAQLGTTPYQYRWLAVADSLLARPIVTIISDSVFFLKVIDKNACLAFDTVKYRVNKPTLLNTGASRYICIGDSTTLGGNPTATNSYFDYKYQWFPGNYSASNPVVMPQTTTTYRLVASTYFCKPDTAFITVTVNSLPKPYTSADTVTIGNGDNISVSAFGGLYYRWFPEEYISDKFAPSPSFFPDFTTTYFVEVTDSFGCRAVDTVLVQVINRLFIPSLFSPNDDGQNDLFHVYGTGIKQLSLRIFDSFNRMVYKSDDLQEIKQIGWDGSRGGEKLPSGAYMWEIEGLFYDDKPITYQGKKHGIVTLVR